MDNLFEKRVPSTFGFEKKIDVELIKCEYFFRLLFKFYFVCSRYSIGRHTKYFSLVGRQNRLHYKRQKSRLPTSGGA